MTTHHKKHRRSRRRMLASIVRMPQTYAVLLLAAAYVAAYQFHLEPLLAVLHISFTFTASSVAAQATRCSHCDRKTRHRSRAKRERSEGKADWTIQIGG